MVSIYFLMIVLLVVACAGSLAAFVGSVHRVRARIAEMEKL